MIDKIPTNIIIESNTGLEAIKIIFDRVTVIGIVGIIAVTIIFIYFYNHKIKLHIKDK